MEFEDVLIHYGVKGMKWGVSRRSGPSGSPSEDVRKVIEAKAKARAAGGIHSLNNDEVRAIVERMNLERQYNTLNPKKSPLKTGQQVAKEILSVANMANQVITLSKSPVATLIKEQRKG
jgi:hypothetical protein